MTNDAKIILSIMNDYGLSQSELARQLGVHRSAISQVIIGLTKQMGKIYRALNNHAEYRKYLEVAHN